MEQILPYSALLAMPIVECGETLIVGQDAAPEIEWHYEKQDMVPLFGEQMFLRDGALARLRRASVDLQALLPSAKLRVVYAYRHPRIQVQYFNRRFEEFQARYPEATTEQIRELAHAQSASPDVAGHPTGGAVDLTIVMPDGAIDMGTAIADFAAGERIHTFCAGLTSEQRANRQLLRTIMMGAGFAPYNGEWWHFSYGDREWAAYYRSPPAIYDQIDR